MSRKAEGGVEADSRLRQAIEVRSQTRRLFVADLFAGVGGFRLGMESDPRYETAWSNQWEPGGERRQFASRCYQRHFSRVGSPHFNEDIESLLSRFEQGEVHLRPVDVVVGGFPCQDYSVAKAKNQSHGLRGKKGVLWWQIHRLVGLLASRGHAPRALVLENVDRLLKSPATQRGRDFAVMIASLADLGYVVEWRVVNAADYGFPQRRRRVFIVAYRDGGAHALPLETIYRTGVLSRALPCAAQSGGSMNARSFTLDGDLAEISESFGSSSRGSSFGNAGVLIGREVATCDVVAVFGGVKSTLRDVLLEPSRVPDSFYIPEKELPKWREHKGSKKIPRSHLESGRSYIFSEGAIAFPDPTDRPSRTLLTSEGGATPSRTRHVVKVGRRYRRLVPVELERLNGFRSNWTATGMSDSQRAYCMGNALVIGVVRRIARSLADRLLPATAREPK